MVAKADFGHASEMGRREQALHARTVDIQFAERCAEALDFGKTNAGGAATMAETHQDDAFRLLELNMAIRRGSHGAGIDQPRVGNDETSRVGE